MPYVSIKVTREQKAKLIKGATDLLVDLLGKEPGATFVVIDEVDPEDRGVGGLPVEACRALANR